jgi:N-acetylmuramoyl-L-alanine amidase
MAQDVVVALGRDIGLLQNPQRQAAFMVLKAPDIPSILVEMGFMSSPKDEAALRRADYRARVASAMKRAVDAYFSALPGTRVAG